MNAIKVIQPYKALGLWVFDYPNVGLDQEPFVGGADTIIDAWTESFKDPDKGIRLMF